MAWAAFWTARWRSSTGGGSGIGEATARRLAEAGCKVVVAGRRKAEIARVAGDISGLAVATDVSVEDDVKALFQACDDAYGRLDVLVNNAGIGGARMALADMAMADWDRTIAVNLRGVAMCIQVRGAAAETPGRRHRQRLVARRGAGLAADAQRLRGQQVRHDRSHRGGGPGTGAAGHPRQRRLPGPPSPPT